MGDSGSIFWTVAARGNLAPRPRAARRPRAVCGLVLAGVVMRERCVRHSPRRRMPFDLSCSSKTLTQSTTTHFAFSFITSFTFNTHTHAFNTRHTAHNRHSPSTPPHSPTRNLDTTSISSHAALPPLFVKSPPTTPLVPSSISHPLSSVIPPPPPSTTSSPLPIPVLTIQHAPNGVAGALSRVTDADTIG